MPEYYIDGDKDRAYQVETLEEGRYEITTPDGEVHVVDAFEPEEGRLHVLNGTKSRDISLRVEDETFEITYGGTQQAIDVLNERQMRMQVAGVSGRGGGGPELVSPMTGTVVSIEADPGDAVEAGETLVIVEAMKMENDLKAHKSGVLDEVMVGPGDGVDSGDVLLTITED